MKMPLRACGVFFVEHDDAGGDAGAVKEVRRQADDALDDAALDEVSCGWQPQRCRGTKRRAAGCTRLYRLGLRNRRMCSR